MNKSASDWEIWLYVLLYFAFLGGLLYLTKFITPLPFILLILVPSISYLIYKEKLAAVDPKHASSILALLWLVVIIAVIAFLAKPYRYESYIGKLIVPGKMITKTITVEADEGPNTWKERRTYWQPNTKTGEKIMSIISWLNLALVVASVILCIRFYSITKEKEDKLKRNSRYLSNYD